MEGKKIRNKEDEDDEVMMGRLEVLRKEVEKVGKFQLMIMPFDLYFSFEEYFPLSMPSSRVLAKFVSL